MFTATFRFYAELNDLLPPARRHRDIIHTFGAPGVLKDRIEALGVPHTEVELILRNGEPVAFSQRIQDGDRVSVYPFLALLENPHPLRPPPPAGRFVLDQHLTRLAAYLRLLGFDALCRVPFPDAELAQISAGEDRVLLTRDKGVLMRAQVVHGHFVRALHPRQQVPEILHRFGARATLAPFSRCMRCNAALGPVPREQVAHRLHAATLDLYERYWTCPVCDRIFWEGPHVRRMASWVDQWVREAGRSLGR